VGGWSTTHQKGQGWLQPLLKWSPRMAMATLKANRGWTGHPQEESRVAWAPLMDFGGGATTPGSLCGWPITHWGGWPATVRVFFFRFFLFFLKKEEKI